MKMNLLGDSGISVSRLCLGTMTFGKQNSEIEGHQQLNVALDYGINFIDTAEMYPIPRDPDTQGQTEMIIGSWIKEKRNRDRVVLATKITGPGNAFAHIRGGDLKFNQKQVEEAVNLSLKRLQTDYIDLYQTHWPERPGNYFGKLGYSHNAAQIGTPIEEQIEALYKVVKAGKVRAFGSSNETPWGQMKFIELTRQLGSDSFASIQNPYNLLNRSFEIGHAEIAIREHCGLLAYSPLAFGTLSGKYITGSPQGSRLALFPEFQRYLSERAKTATRQYVSLAHSVGLEPAQMAIAFASRQKFITSVIIGATSVKQLKHNVKSEEVNLSGELLQKIEDIHLQNPNPAP